MLNRILHLTWVSIYSFLAADLFFLALGQLLNMPPSPGLDDMSAFAVICVLTLGFAAMAGLNIFLFLRSAHGGPSDGMQ